MANTGRPTSSPWTATNLIALAILVVTLAGLAVVFDDDAAAPPDDHPEADLIAAYERSRLGTYAVDAEFTRTMPDGRQLKSAALVAQRPPDQVRWELGSVSGHVNGRRLNCAPDPQSGEIQCAPTGPATSHDDDVAKEVANLRSYFAGPTPVYRASRAGPGCFTLEQIYLALPDAPYGRETTMCFDVATGAMTEFEMRREGGSVDRLHALTVRSQVTDADFTLDDWSAFQPETEGT